MTIHGTGKPPFVVGIAGIGTRIGAYDYQSQLLSEATFIDIDRPGLGGCDSRPDPRKPVTVAEIAAEYGETIRGVCDAKGFVSDDLIVASHSFGGNIARLLVSQASDYGLHFRGWVDYDGSAPELLAYITRETPALLFDGPIYETFSACAEKTRQVPERQKKTHINVTHLGEVEFDLGSRTLSFKLADLLTVSPLDLVTSNEQIRLAELPRDLQYCRVNRDPGAHRNDGGAGTTSEAEDYWLVQGVYKALAAEGAFVIAKGARHPFPFAHSPFFQQPPNNRLAAEVLRGMLDPRSGNLRHGGVAYSRIQKAGGEIIDVRQLLEFADAFELSPDRLRDPPSHDDWGFPHTRVDDLRELPRSLAMRDPLIQRMFTRTVEPRSPINLLREIAYRIGARDVVEGIDRCVAENPSLGVGEGADWLPPEQAVRYLAEEFAAGANSETDVEPTFDNIVRRKRSARDMRGATGAATPGQPRRRGQ